MLDPKRLWRAFRHLRRGKEVLRCAAGLRGWPRTVARYLGLVAPRLPAVLHFRNGVELGIREFYDLETVWQVWFRRVYPVRPADRIVIDAGANVGYFAVFAAAQNPECRIWAIEPFAQTYERLLKTVADNGFSNRISCHRLALAATRTQRQMSSSAAPSQLMSLLPPGSAPGNSVPVAAVTLAGFLEENGLDRVDLLKMDIEGSEFEVLLTAETDTLRRFGRIEVEYHKPSGTGSKQDIIRRLNEAGFDQTFDTGQADAYGIAHFERH